MSSILALPLVSLDATTSLDADWRMSIAVTSPDEAGDQQPIDLRNINYTLRVWRAPSGHEVLLEASSSTGQLSVGGDGHNIFTISVLQDAMEHVPLGTWAFDVLAEAEGAAMDFIVGEIEHLTVGGPVINSVSAAARVPGSAEQPYAYGTGPAGPVPWLSPPVQWATGTDYQAEAPASLIEVDGSTYVCAITHTSANFGTDFGAGRWSLVAAKGAPGSIETGSTVPWSNITGTPTTLAGYGITDGGGGGGSAGFDTKAQVESTNIPVGTSMIRVNGYYAAGDHPGANYVPVSAQPAHVACIQSADGQWWELARWQVWTPEMVGVIPNDPSDQTVAFNNFTYAINAIFPPVVELKPGAYYTVFSDRTMWTGSWLMQFWDWHGFKFNFNGAEIRLTAPSLVGGDIAYVINFQGCSGFELNDFYATQTATVASNLYDRGTRHVVCNWGCHDFEINRMMAIRGLVMFSDLRNVDSEAEPCYNYHVSGYSWNVFYGVNQGHSGSNSSFNIETVGAGRSWIAYGADLRCIRGIIKSTPSGAAQDLSFGGAGWSSGGVMEDVRIDYYSPYQQAYCAVAIITNSQADPNLAANYAAHTRDVHLKFNVGASTHMAQLVALNSWVFPNYAAGDINGSRMTNIFIEGMVHNDGEGSSPLIEIGTAAKGFTTNTKVNVSLRDFSAVGVHYAAGNTIRVGANAVLTLRDCDLPDVTVVREGAPFGGFFNVQADRSVLKDTTLVAQSNRPWSTAQMLPNYPHGGLPMYNANVGPMNYEHTIAYCPDGGSGGGACLAVWDGGYWKRIDLGGNIT